MHDNREDVFAERSERLDATAAKPVRRRAQRLTPELREARLQQARGVLAEESAAVTTVPARETRQPTDPAAAIRLARIGFFAALVLFTLLLWIRQSRKENRS